MSGANFQHVQQHAHHFITSAASNETPRRKRRGMIEKMRRDKINQSLAELRRLVPTAHESQTTAKLEKSEILQLTVDYLRQIRAKGLDKLLTAKNTEELLLQQHTQTSQHFHQKHVPNQYPHHHNHSHSHSQAHAHVHSQSQTHQHQAAAVVVQHQLHNHPTLQQQSQQHYQSQQQQHQQYLHHNYQSHQLHQYASQHLISQQQQHSANNES